MCYPVTSCARDLGRTAISITTCQKKFVCYQSSQARNSASTERIWMKKVSYLSQKVSESENATDISSELKLYLTLQSLILCYFGNFAFVSITCERNSLSESKAVYPLKYLCPISVLRKGRRESVTVEICMASDY